MIKGNSSSTTPSNPPVSIDPSKLPKYEENEVVYFDPINYKLCDNESDTCYAWLVLHGNTDEGKYELVYKNTGVYDYNKALENNGGSYDGVLVNYISKITETWSDKIPKPEAKYNINSTFDFTGLKARIMNTNELSENDNALLNKLSICPASANLPCLIMGESTYYYIMQNTMQSSFGFSGASAPFYINPVIRVDLTTVENIKDYIDDGTIKYVCNEHIYDNGTMSEAEYNKVCKDYIDESLYSTSANSDGTVNISGFKSSTPSSYKNNVWALPTKIDGKTVTGISTGSFAQKGISSKLIISPTIKTIDSNSFVSNSILALALPDSVTSIGATSFAGNSISSLIVPGSVELIDEYAFVSNNISKLTLKEGIKTLNNFCFGNNSFKSIKLPDSLTTVGIAFNGTPIETLDTGGGFKITVDAFLSLKSSLKNLAIGSDTLQTEQTFEDAAFQNFTVLETLTIRKNVKTLSTRLFELDSKLTTVTLPSTIENIGDYAFNKCFALSNVELPNGLISIGKFSLSNMNLKSITIPSTVTSIGNYAFYNNSNLTTIDDNSGLSTCSMVSSNTTINNKKNNTSLTCSAN